jgi:parvulin-like peptidyl-prolyl isomerase
MLCRTLSTLCIVLTLFCTFSNAEDNDPVLGKAGDYVFTKSALDRLISYYAPEKQKFLQDNPQQKITLVKRALEVKIISDLARKEGFDQRPEVKEQLAYTMNDQLAREYLTKGMGKDITVTDKEIREYYDTYTDKFSTPEQVRARHILIRIPPDLPDAEKEKAKDKIRAALERIRKGEDFAIIAAEISEDSVTKAKGGDLGYFSRGKMVKAFEDASFSLKPGQVSDIVETLFGYHIIKVEDYKESYQKPFESIKDTIREQLRSEALQSWAKEILRKATADAGMEIYPDKILGMSQDK